MPSKSSRRTKSPPFLMVPRYLYRSKAWHSLDGNARSIFLELVDRFNGHNNGTISLGNRDAGALFDRGKDTGRRGLDMLLERGFIAVTSDSTFDQKRLAREWRLTHLPDDRTGHKASKDFMIWGAENQKLGAQVRSIGAQVRSEPSKSAENTNHRRTHAPVSTKPEGSQAHPCATSRYTISPATEAAQAVAEEASPPKGRDHRSNGPAVGMITNLSTAVDISLVTSSVGTSAPLMDPERSLLRWLVNFEGQATHRKAQQNLSGQLKGEAIARAAVALAARGLIRIGEKGRSRVYILLDAGKNPALLDDADQLDLEHWLAGTRQ